MSGCEILCGRTVSRAWIAVCAIAIVAGARAAPAFSDMPPPASVPPSLQELELKMAQIRFNTGRISVRFGIGELGSPGGDAELGVGVKGSEGGLLTSTVGTFKISPHEATATSKLEELGVRSRKQLPLRDTTSTERVIGKTVYTYKPSVERYDGGRPWVRSKQAAPKSKGESTGSADVSNVLDPTLSSGDGHDDSAAPFAKLIEDLDDALSIQEVGPVTVDGQQVTEFTALIPLARLLSPKQIAAFAEGFGGLGLLLSTNSPKQHEEAQKRHEEEVKKLTEAVVGFELFIAPSGLPVRTTAILGSWGSGIGEEEDILALEVPVVVHPPSSRKTIDEAQLLQLERERARRVCRPVRAALKRRPVLCPRRAALAPAPASSR